MGPVPFRKESSAFTILDGLAKDSWADEDEPRRVGEATVDENQSEGAIVRLDNSLIQLERFQFGLFKIIEGCGLPARGVLVPMGERLNVLRNLDTAVRNLDPQRREHSVYVSKFIAATAAGLFDAALNYLWDETISELRRRIAMYDLSYFYDIAVPNPDRRKKLSTADDLTKIEDSELIRGANEIGLISDLAFKHLDYIRYMRNWASAAHPNQNEITGLQLVSWLETCLREVITPPPSDVTIQIGRLLENIKTNQIGADEARQIGVFFADLPQDRVDSLAAGLYGIYCQQDSAAQTRDNIRLLAPHLWPRVSETTRKQFGVKYAQYVANNDQEQARFAREFMDVVGAADYIPDGLRAAELETAIQNLLTAHRGLNNFYNEPAFARQLKTLVGDAGAVPPQVEERYVMALVEVYLTNGNGVAWNAEPVYLDLLSKLPPQSALAAILAFRDSRIASRLQFDLCQRKYKELFLLLEPKITAPAARETLESIRAFTGPLDRMRDDARIRRSLKNLATILGR
jgi:hypothetical protein